MLFVFMPPLKTIKRPLKPNKFQVSSLREHLKPETRNLEPVSFIASGLFVRLQYIYCLLATRLRAAPAGYIPRLPAMQPEYPAAPSPCSRKQNQRRHLHTHKHLHLCADLADGCCHRGLPLRKRCPYLHSAMPIGVGYGSQRPPTQRGTLPCPPLLW